MKPSLQITKLLCIMRECSKRKEGEDSHNRLEAKSDDSAEFLGGKLE